MTEFADWVRESPLARWFGQQPEPEPEPVVGLVLSGGGARSSFQIGALRYLYDVAKIEPSVIAGTSAGSILSTILAQYDDHAGQRAALDQLEEIWLDMRTSSDMFAEYPWFTRLRENLPTWRKVLTMRARPASEKAGAGWSPSTALEALGTLWEAGRASADLQIIARGPSEERAAFTPGPIVDRLLDPEVFDPERLARSRITLRIAVVSLETGELRYVTSTGEFRDRCDRPIAELGEVPVAEAVHASCAIPGVFPPVLLEGEHYVDGGVRENLPAQVVLERLGVNRCYAIVASPAGVTPREGFADADMFDIVMRSTTGIMADELQRDEVEFAAAAGATIIAPTLDIHDLATIDPGLIAIAVDYGYLRAQDVLTRADAERQRLTDDVIGLRRQIWDVEEKALAALTTTERRSVLTELGKLKRRLRDHLALIPDDELPEGARGWWQRWERHADEVDHPVVWLPRATTRAITGS